MNVSITSTGSLTEALDDLNRQLTKAQRDVGRTVAGVGRRVILEQAKARRGTLSMSGVNVKRLGASAKIRPTPTQATVTLTAKPAGPWAITEYGTAPQVIRARIKDGLKVGNAVYEEVNHPGARGFGIWNAATAGAGDSEIERAIAAKFDQAVDEAMV
jgi:methylthioribose-1-phosphate isomerase